MLKIATVFTGIGAVEHALKRINKKYKLVFASDNGGIEWKEKYSEEEIKKIEEEIFSLSNNEKRRLKTNEIYSKSKKTNYVKKSYFSNYEIKENQWFDDVKYINGEEFKGKVDLFVGGSPCQSFSLSGKQGGLEDTRGTLFYEYARLVKEIEPKVFIYENVRGMLTHDKGRTWDTIKKVFDDLGYNYKFKILNSKNYGIPQNRNRLIVVGFKEENDFEFPLEITLKKTMQDFLQSNTKKIQYINNRIFDSSEGIEIEEKYFLSDLMIKNVLSPGTKNFKTTVGTDLEIARPLLSTMHKMHRSGVDNYVTTNGRLRRLTPREALRLMGFCDTFEQVVSDTQMYKQAGNSIVVDLLIEVLKAIFKTKII